MISEAYGGEKFGKGVYYRLVYGTKKDQRRQEIILVFEEKLLINTVGKILGIQTGKLDTMLVHAARYTARQFVSRVLEHFPAEEGSELREENLLTYEQFKKIFEREEFQASLLFNTGGAGYFAYCVIAPHLLKANVATPIGAENAMDEVEKYLMKREQADSGRRRPSTSARSWWWTTPSPSGRASSAFWSRTTRWPWRTPAWRLSAPSL